jgi:large subunit ribosomal protein L29
MRADKVREQDSAELQSQLRESQDQLFRLRFQFGMGQMDGLKKYRELKRDRARMLGVLRERELDPAKAAEAEKNAAANAKKRGKKGK